MPGYFSGEDRAALARATPAPSVPTNVYSTTSLPGLEPMLAGDVLVQNAHGIGAQDHRRLFGGETHTL